MCGETFSSKFSPDQKAAAAKAHPLASPGRWRIGYTESWGDQHDPRRFDNHERAWIDRDGYSTKEEARKALFAEDARVLDAPSRRTRGGFFSIPPLEESGDHRIRTALASGEVSTDDLANFVDAVLNNRQAQFEPLRERLAAASLVAPPAPAPKLTRAEAAQALVAALVPPDQASAERWLDGDYSPGPGNAVILTDFSDEDHQQDGRPGGWHGDVYYAFNPDQSRAIHAAVKAYFEAEED